jgi:hypothetical protein
VGYPACLTTGIEQVDEPQFALYPNPAGSEINILFSNNITGDLHIEVLDIWGQLAYSAWAQNTYNGNKYAVNINQLAAGVYLLKVSNGENKFGVKRFVKL